VLIVRGGKRRNMKRDQQEYSIFCLKKITGSGLLTPGPSRIGLIEEERKRKFKEYGERRTNAIGGLKGKII